MKRLKQITLFILFPEAGFRKDVQQKKISKTKIIYCISINFVFPLIFLIIGLIIFNNEPLKREIQTWQTTELPVKFDDYGRYAPIPFIFLLDQFGPKARSPFIVRVITFTTSYVIGDFIVYRTKKLTKEERPGNKQGDYSFPSQHTNQSFLGSMTLHHEYIGSKGGMAISSAGMICASGVGYLRYARDSHWSCDVLVGVAVGMMTVNIIYMFLWGLVSLAVNKAWFAIKNRIRKKGKQL